MSVLLIEYPSCSTCRKAKKYLQSLPVEVTTRHIVEQTPTYDELEKWWKQSGLPLDKFFNTSGNVYREMKLKDTLKLMSEDEKLTLLSKHGMLIKRPILITNSSVFVGFREENYKSICSK